MHANLRISYDSARFFVVKNTEKVCQFVFGKVFGDKDLYLVINCLNLIQIQ